MDSKRYVDVRGAAMHTGYSKSTLDKMRSRGEGPPYFKPGRRKVIYALEDLDAWIARARREAKPGSQADGDNK